MRHCTATASMLAIAALLGTAPASATNKTPSGNAGGQGQAKGVTTGRPPAFYISRPSVSGRDAYVTQIGETNRASVRQSAPDARAEVVQTGDRNDAEVVQNGRVGYAQIRQIGDSNAATATQSGKGGNTLFLAQLGSHNSAVVSQESAMLENGARLLQSGQGNVMTLAQSGNDNQAQLTQQGDNNVMNAAQTGAGNRLDWTQQGSGLASLSVTQTGGQAIQIVQTR